MGFLSKMLGATVKTVLTPIAFAKDVIDTAQGNDASNTEDLVEDIVDDVKDAVDDLTDVEL